MVLTYLPLMILPLYAVMVRLDDDLIEAATDLGASSVAVWWTIILPLTLPGVIAGSLLVLFRRSGNLSFRHLSAGRSIDDGQGVVDGIFPQPRLAGGGGHCDAVASRPCRLFMRGIRTDVKIMRAILRQVRHDWSD